MKTKEESKALNVNMRLCTTAACILLPMDLSQCSHIMKTQEVAMGSKTSYTISFSYE